MRYRGVMGSSRKQLRVGAFTVRCRVACPCAQRQLNSWEFDPFDNHDAEDLVSLILYMFVQCRLPSFFPFTEEAVMGFVDSVRAHMELYGNPYHAFSHAFDVMHGVFLFLTTMGGSYVKQRRGRG